MEKEKSTTNIVNSKIDINTTSLKRMIKSVTTIDEYDVNGNVIKHTETEEYYNNSILPCATSFYPTTSTSSYNPISTGITYTYHAKDYRSNGERTTN